MDQNEILIWDLNCHKREPEIIPEMHVRPLAGPLVDGWFNDSKARSKANGGKLYASGARKFYNLIGCFLVDRADWLKYRPKSIACGETDLNFRNALFDWMLPHISRANWLLKSSFAGRRPAKLLYWQIFALFVHGLCRDVLCMILIVCVL